MKKYGINDMNKKNIEFIALVTFLFSLLLIDGATAFYPIYAAFVISVSGFLRKPTSLIRSP